MNNLCKLIKKYSCTIIIALCTCIILMSLYNSGIVSESFQISQNDTTHVIALFHANWCGHCKKLMPEWIKFTIDQAKETLRKHNLLDEQTIIELHDIENYSQGLSHNIEISKTGREFVLIL